MESIYTKRRRVEWGPNEDNDTKSRWKTDIPTQDKNVEVNVERENTHLKIISSRSKSNEKETLFKTKYRTPYKHIEDKTILNFMLENGGYRHKGGTCLWKEMERKEICPGRTWQSMKQRFLYFIQKNLTRFHTTKEALSLADIYIQKVIEKYNGANSDLSKEDHLEIETKLDTHKSVPSVVENKLCGQLEKNILCTCNMEQKTIRLKDARIMKLEEEIEIKTEQIKEMVKGQYSKAQNLSIVEDKLRRLKGENVALTKKQTGVNLDKVGIEAANKELLLEIKQLQNARDEVGKKGLDYELAVQTKLDKAVKDLHDRDYELDLKINKITSMDEELSKLVFKVEKLEISYQELKSKHGECGQKEYKWMEERTKTEKRVNILNKIIAKHEETLTSMGQNQDESQSLLNEKTEYIKELNFIVLTHTEALTSSEQNLDKSQSLIKEKTECIKELILRIAKHEDTLNSLEQNQVKSQSLLMEKTENIKELSLIISKHEETLTSLEQNRGESQSLLKEKTKYIKELNIIVSKHEESLTSSGQKQGKTQSLLKENTEYIKELDKIISKHEEASTSMEKNLGESQCLLEEKTEYIKELNLIISKHEVNLTSMEQNQVESQALLKGKTKYVRELNLKISKHKEKLTSMEQNYGESQSLLMEKNEHIKVLQTTLKSLEKRDGREAATRQVDKLVIKQKLEEIEDLKAKLAYCGDLFASIFYLECAPGSLTDATILKSTSVTLETDLISSAGPRRRNSCSDDEGEKTHKGGKASNVVDHIMKCMYQSPVEMKSKYEDWSIPSTSDRGLINNEDKSVPDEPSLQQSLFSPFLPPSSSDAPAKTSQKTHGIRLKSINTLSPFFENTDLILDEVVIPKSIYYDADTAPVDMDIISEEEVERLAIDDKNSKKIQVLVETKFKYFVAKVVKKCLGGFYPRQTLRADNGWLIKSAQEFTYLAEKFSKQFREQILLQLYNSENVGLEGLLLTSPMLAQIIFYFSVRMQVYKRLTGLVKSNHSKFQSCLSRYSESLMLELTDSHVTMGGSVVDLTMTEDSRLYINCQVKRLCSADLICQL